MIQSIQDLLKETVAAEEREERCRLLSDKVDKHRMEEAELEAELRGLEAGEERRGSNASQVVELLPGHGGRAAVHYGNGKSEVPVRAFARKAPQKIRGSDPPMQRPGKEEGREENEEEQEQREVCLLMDPPAPGGSNEGLSASLVFDPARFRGATGESGGSGNLNGPYDRKRSLSRSPRGER